MPTVGPLIYKTLVLLSWIGHDALMFKLFKLNRVGSGMCSKRGHLFYPHHHQPLCYRVLRLLPLYYFLFASYPRALSSDRTSIVVIGKPSLPVNQ